MWSLPKGHARTARPLKILETSKSAWPHWQRKKKSKQRKETSSLAARPSHTPTRHGSSPSPWPRRSVVATLLPNRFNLSLSPTTITAPKTTIIYHQPTFNHPKCTLFSDKHAFTYSIPFCVCIPSHSPISPALVTHAPASAQSPEFARRYFPRFTTHAHWGPASQSSLIR